MADYIDPMLAPDIRQAIQRNMPYNPRTINPKLSIIGASADPNTLGWVDRNMGPSIFYNFNSPSLKRPTLPGHELEHILQNEVSNRYPKGYDTQVIDEYHRMRGNKSTRDGTTGALIDHLINVGKHAPLNEYLTKLSGTKTAPYIGKMPDNQYSLKEQWAELSAIEQYVKQDLTKDPYIRKEFFNNDDDLIAAYRGTTGLRTTRLDAKDLPPMTAQKENQQPKPEPSFLQKLNKIIGR
jgi:hypothetical protein